MLKFTIPGEPKAQARARSTVINGRVHTYGEDVSRNYKNYVKMIAQVAATEQGWTFAGTEGIGVNIYAYMYIPQSKSKKFHAAAMAGDERPTKKPDVDNIFKAVSDALNGVLYGDDKQIIHARVEKHYSDEPRVEVEVFVCRKELL